MTKDSDHKSVTLAIRKNDKGWFVQLPDHNKLGPYHNAEVTLEVAATHALLERNRGIVAEIVVQDSSGGSHHCMIVDWITDPNRCQKCERAWATSDSSPRCPLWQDMKG